MNNQHTLFTQVQDYYADLVSRIETAQHTISMTYLSFDDGKWAGRIANALRFKANAGVRVRLMVDEIGQILDEPRHMVRNISLFRSLKDSGVELDIFQPRIPELWINNRLHCKIAAIDHETVYLGGSNIGDYYTDWSDTNLRIDGQIGNTMHNLYDYLRSFSTQAKPNIFELDLSGEFAGTDQLWLTVPGRQFDVRSALLNLILNAEHSVHIRTWYFLPDEEILDALCMQAERGVQVSVLLSHETRVRPIDFANRIHIHRLACAGGNIYRFTGRYMHSKVAWNDYGDVLFGSANLDPHSMRKNFESCLQIRDQTLTWALQRAFERDLHSSLHQTPDVYRRLSFPNKILSHTCNLASSWL